MNKIPAKYLGPLLILLGLLPLLVYATQIRQLLFPRATYTGIPSRVLVNPGRIQMDVVSNSPLYLSAQAVDTGGNNIMAGVTYVWGISSTNSVGNLIVKDNTAIATFISQNTGLGDIWVKAITSSGEATSSIPVCIGPPCPSPLTPINPISWQIPSVSLAADDAYIEISGHKFYGRPDANTTLSLGPAPTATTDPRALSAQAQWIENGFPITLKLFFYRNDTHWWIQGYSYSSPGLGEATTGPLVLLSAPLGNPITFSGSYTPSSYLNFHVSNLVLQTIFPPINLPPTITTNSLPPLTLGTAYSATLEATDPDPDDRLTATVNLPSDQLQSICASSTTAPLTNCSITGTLTNASGYSALPVSFTVTDNHGLQARSNYTLTVLATPISCLTHIYTANDTYRPPYGFYPENLVSSQEKAAPGKYYLYGLEVFNNTPHTLSNYTITTQNILDGNEPIEVVNYSPACKIDSTLKSLNCQISSALGHNSSYLPVAMLVKVTQPKIPQPYLSTLFAVRSSLGNTECATNLAIPVRYSGDLNENGHIDIFDYNILVAEFGKIGNSMADINANGKVDIFDYNILVANFGK